MSYRNCRRHAAWLSLVASLTACGGGGSSPTRPDTTEPPTVRVAGTARIAAAQVGVATEAAPDGALVELIAWTNGTATTLASTNVKAGRYQFDAPGVVLGAGTQVQVNVGGTVYRAPAFTNDVDVSPFSEAVLATATAEKFRAGAVTAREYDALLQAGQFIGDLARQAPGATAAALSPANLRRLLASDAAYAAYLQAAELDAGTTTTVLGDIGDMLPLTTGMRWQYLNQDGHIVPLINAGVGDGSDTVAIKTQITNGTVQQWSKKADGLYSSASVDLRIQNRTIKIALGEQLLAPFAPKVGLEHAATAALTRSVPDLDGDRMAESISVSWKLQVQAIEPQPVLGVPTVTMRVARQLTAQLTLSADKSVGTLQTDETYWLAPKIGIVRAQSATSIDHPLLRQNATQQQTLRAFAPDAGPLRFDGGTLQAIPLNYSRIVTDLPRRRLLALLNGDELAQGRSLASVDIDTGAVTYAPASIGAIDALAVAPTGEVFAAVSTTDPNGGVCASTGTVVRLGATTLREESRQALPKGAGQFCAPGRVMFLQALSADTLIVQTASAEDELMRLDNGVRAPAFLHRTADLLLSSPLQKVFVVGDAIYLVPAHGSPHRSRFDANGIGFAESLNINLTDGHAPWIAGTRLRAGGQELDLVGNVEVATALKDRPCNLQSVAGYTDRAACGVMRSTHLGEFMVHDWVSGRELVNQPLPWVQENWMGTVNPALIVDERTAVYMARPSGGWVDEFKLTKLYIARRAR